MRARKRIEPPQPTSSVHGSGAGFLILEPIIACQANYMGKTHRGRRGDETQVRREADFQALRAGHAAAEEFLRQRAAEEPAEEAAEEPAQWERRTRARQQPPEEQWYEEDEPPAEQPERQPEEEEPAAAEGQPVDLSSDEDVQQLLPKGKRGATLTPSPKRDISSPEIYRTHGNSGTSSGACGSNSKPDATSNHLGARAPTSTSGSSSRRGPSSRGPRASRRHWRRGWY